MDKEKLKSILIKANTLQEGKEIALASEFISIDEKINDTAKEIDLKLSEMQEDLKKKLEEELIYEVDEQKIVQSVLSKVEIPDPIPGKDGKSGKDGKDYVLTKSDKKEIASSIKVPVIEKVIEKTEVIKEIPEEVTGESIVDKINELEIKPEKQIDAKHIKNLPKTVSKGGHSPTVLANAVDLDQSARADGYAIVWDSTNNRFKFSPDSTGIDGTMVLNRIPYGFDADTLQTSANLTFDGSLQTITADSLGVTQDNTKGFFIRNTTAAAAGAQQISPSIHWQGQGWKTNATAESRPIDFRAYVYTYQGSTNPNGMWFLESSVNSGAYNAVLGVGLAGDLYLRSGGSGLSGQVLQSGGANIASSWLTLNSIATAGLSSGSGTTASGNSVNWAGTLTTNADIDANNSHRIMISNIANNHAGISYATNEPKVTWDIDGSWGLRRRLVDNTEHTVEYFDSIISVKTDSSTGAVVLPDASTSTGRIITVKFYDNTSVYNIGVSASSGNVQSASDFSLGGSYSMPITGQRAISWQSNGTDWEIVWTQDAGGNVVGAASATDNNVVFFDGTTGKLIKDSGLTLSGTNTGDQTTITGNAGSATILQTTRTIWGQNFNGSANVTGSLIAVGDITGGASSMIIQAGTGASRTLTLKTTTGASVVQTNLTLNADQSSTFSGNVALGANSLTMTGSLAATGARVTKGWFTDVESTNMPTVGGVSLSSTFQGLDTQLTSLAGLSYTGNALKVVRVNAGETDFELATLAGGSGLTHPEVMSRVSLRF